MTSRSIALIFRFGNDQLRGYIVSNTIHIQNVSSKSDIKFCRTALFCNEPFERYVQAIELIFKFGHLEGNLSDPFLSRKSN